MADTACERITADITRVMVGSKPTQARARPLQSHGQQRPRQLQHRQDRAPIDRPRRCQLNWAILDSDWEAEFCRVAEAHPRMRAYAKNHNLGLEVPNRCGSVLRGYRPDFIVRIDGGHGDQDLLSPVVEIKGYRREGAKGKEAAMETHHWVRREPPGQLGSPQLRG